MSWRTVWVRSVNAVGRLALWLSRWCDDVAWRLDYCEKCGEPFKRHTLGDPCPNAPARREVEEVLVKSDVCWHSLTRMAEGKRIVCADCGAVLGEYVPHVPDAGGRDGRA
jgi:predicted amidophosphoribosyltransferase